MVPVALCSCLVTPFCQLNLLSVRSIHYWLFASSIYSHLTICSIWFYISGSSIIIIFLAAQFMVAVNSIYCCQLPVCRLNLLLPLCQLNLLLPYCHQFAVTSAHVVKTFLSTKSVTGSWLLQPDLSVTERNCVWLLSMLLPLCQRVELCVLLNLLLPLCQRVEMCAAAASGEISCPVWTDDRYALPPQAAPPCSCHGLPGLKLEI